MPLAKASSTPPITKPGRTHPGVTQEMDASRFEVAHVVLADGMKLMISQNTPDAQRHRQVSQFCKQVGARSTVALKGIADEDGNLKQGRDVGARTSLSHSLRSQNRPPKKRFDPSTARSDTDNTLTRREECQALTPYCIDGGGTLRCTHLGFQLNVSMQDILRPTAATNCASTNHGGASGHMLRSGLHHIRSCSDVMVKASGQRDERNERHRKQSHDDSPYDLDQEGVQVCLHNRILGLCVSVLPVWTPHLKLG